MSEKFNEFVTVRRFDALVEMVWIEIKNSETVRIEEPKLIEVGAFGELDGQGTWTLTAEDQNTTRVQYNWKVKTTKSWMNFLAPVAKPFFRRNHNIIMNWRGAGQAKKLDCRMLESKEN